MDEERASNQEGESGAVAAALAAAAKATGFSAAAQQN